MAPEIYFRENLTVHKFYTEIVDQVGAYISSKDKGVTPVFNFESLDYIEAKALPLIMALGDYLSNYYSKPIRIELAYKPRLLYFLYNSKFFYYGEKYNIFEYDREYIGGFSDSIKEIYRKEHVILMEPPSSSELIDNMTEEEFEIYRSLVAGELELGTVKNWVTPIMRFNIEEQKLENLHEKDIEEVVSAVSELFTNSKVYSYSNSFGFLQTNKHGTFFSITDSGIGLEKSFGKHERANQLGGGEKKTGVLKEYHIIMDSLSYSRNKYFDTGRKNLWTLRDKLLEAFGELSIHYGHVRVVFSSDRCKECEVLKNKEKVDKCKTCLLNAAKRNPNMSPIRVYKTSFPGVHVEFGYKREE